MTTNKIHKYIFGLISSVFNGRGGKLLVILLLALVIRVWNLNTIPPHLTPDEAALGYNAYSILKTGKDEYGNFF